MRSPTLLLLVGAVCCVEAARRGRRAPAAAEGSLEAWKPPPIGDCIELRGAPRDYIKKDLQIVNVITPGSDNIRMINRKTRKFYGMNRRRGMICWMKQRDRNIFAGNPENPPFKVRFLRLDPRGMALALVKEGKISFDVQDLPGRTNDENMFALHVEVHKPQPWWRKLL